MPRKVITPREIVEAYFFWKWEYERRNENYVKAYDRLIALAKKIMNGSQLRHKHVVLTKTREGKIISVVEEGELLGSPQDVYYMFQIQRPWEPLYIYKIEDEKMKKDIENFVETFGRYPKDPKWGYSGKDIVEFLAEDRKKPIPERSKYPAEDIRGHGKVIEELNRKRAIEDFFKIYGEHPKAPKPGCSREEIVEFLLKYVLKDRKKSPVERSECPAEDIKGQDEAGARASDFFSEYMDEYAPRVKPVGVEIVKWDESEKKLLVEIDVTKPLSVVREGVSTCYLSHSVGMRSKPADFLPLIEHEFGIIKNFLNESELRQLRAWDPRAAGLLLWDYTNPGPTVEDALKVPEIVKSLEDLGYGEQIRLARQAKYVKPGRVAKSANKDSGYRQFRRYRSVTADCITQRKVLPVK